jgi:hypothetical protein
MLIQLLLGRGTIIFRHALKMILERKESILDI